MENKKELQLLRVRSMASVISDGYRLYMSSFRQLFRSSWIVAIVYALAFALMLSNIVNTLIPMQTTYMTFGADALRANPETAKNAVVMLVSVLLYLFAAILLGAQSVHAFREHKATDDISRPQHWYGRLCLKSFMRLLAVGFWLVLLGIIIQVVFAAISTAIVALGVVGNIWRSIASLTLFSVVSLVILALVVPLTYTVMRALLSDKKIVLLPPVKGYGTGMRHWGMLFATLFVVALFTYVLTMVCELPAVIMMMANAKAYAGLAMGDPIGMPEYIVPMTFCLFTVAGFIQAYVHLSSLYPFYYAYGSIEQQRQERLKTKDLDYKL